MFWGMLSVFCYNTIICICYITLLYMLINKFTTGFSEEKLPRKPVVLKMAIQFRMKKWCVQFYVHYKPDSGASRAR